jgi:hypothetical protein
MLYRPCDPAELPFELVGELEDPLGQSARTARSDRPNSPSRCTADRLWRYIISATTPFSPGDLATVIGR